MRPFLHLHLRRPPPLSLLPPAPRTYHPIPIPIPTLTLTRTYTTHPLSSWLAQFPHPPTTSTDTASLLKARQLLLCLPLPGSPLTLPPHRIQRGTPHSIRTLQPGMPMPLGSELVLFNPLDADDSLGADGSDRGAFVPPDGFDQRMWVGGSFAFPPRPSGSASTAVKGAAICVGDEVEREGRVEKVEVKQGRGTGEMLLVWRRFEYRTERGVGAVETRCHVYRRPRPRGLQDASAAVADAAAASPQHTAAKPTAKRGEEERPFDFGWDYYANRATLFRYSAATFNAHRIHLDPEYCRVEEGHADCLVHGPLTASVLMNLVEAVAGARTEAPGQLAEFEYRATSPLVVEQVVRLRGKWDAQDPNRAELWALNEKGTVCMRATATVRPVPEA